MEEERAKEKKTGKKEGRDGCTCSAIRVLLVLLVVKIAMGMGMGMGMGKEMGVRSEK